MTGSDIVLAVSVCAAIAVLSFGLYAAHMEVEGYWVRAPRPPTYDSECRDAGGVPVGVGRYGGRRICLKPDAFVDVGK